MFENYISKLSTSTTDWAVRVNSVSSGFLKDDLKILFSNPKSENGSPKTIFLPKVNDSNDLEEFSKIINNVRNVSNDPINLILYSESCRSIMNLKDICATAQKLYKENNNFLPVGIVFGSDDFLANLGASRNVQDSLNILYARQKVVLIAKAYNLQAIDMVYINFKDLNGLKNQSLEGANMGFTGKQIIHPSQIEIVQNAFLPSPEKIEWARECVKAYEEHQTIGKGAFVFRNQMIDNPTVQQAMNILKLVK